MTLSPPASIAPAEFFESWLPAEYARMTRDLSSPPPDATICVELAGEDGGAWTLTTTRGTLTVTAGPSPASIGVRQSVDDWRTLAQLSSAGVALDGLLTSPALSVLLTTVRGTLRFQIKGYQGRDVGVEVIFQGADAPAASISVDGETLEQMRTGALPVAQAFFSGKLLIDGDAALAMQVGMAVMTPAS